MQSEVSVKKPFVCRVRLVSRFFTLPRGMKLL
jgi:hypothetical protein